MGIYRGIALTVAGSDSGGGAGIQADLKTFAALRVFGMSVITAVTAQNSMGVRSIHNIPEGIIKDQLDSVLSDFETGAVKTGMLGLPGAIKTLCRALKEYSINKLVVDPVMIAQSGDSLIEEDAVSVMRDELLPLALLVTPNIPEAEILSGIKIHDAEGMEKAAELIADFGPGAVLVKGGHMKGDEVKDLLYVNGRSELFVSQRIDTDNTHGTGCTLSSAITAELAAGCDLSGSVARGRKYLRLALENSFRPGHGYGPLGHAVRAEWIK